MPLEPVRFLHVANLRLDHPLRTTAQLSDAARALIMKATHEAWERIVESAVDREVDFVLLNGNTFLDADHSLAAEQSLLSGLEYLREAGIRVVAVPGDGDSAGAWRAVPARDLAILNADADAPLTIPRRDGASVARIVLASAPASVEADDDAFDARDGRQPVPPGDGRLRIGVRPWPADEAASLSARTLPAEVDYWAVGSSAAWRDAVSADVRRLRLSAPQPLSWEEDDRSGCLLVEVDEAGELHCQRLDTAPVRFLTLPLLLEDTTNWEDAALLMQNQLESASWKPHEHLRLIRWQVEGESPLIGDILDGSGGQKLTAAWQHYFAPQEDLQLVHEFEPGQSLDAMPSLDLSHPDLVEELFAILADEELLPREQWLDALRRHDSDAGARDWDRSLPLLDRISAAGVDRQARLVTREWLTAPLTEDHRP